MNVILSYIT